MAISGFLEHASTRHVSGWAYDSSAPSARLEVSVRIGDAFYASGIADIPRQDLLLAGIGDGQHGFVIDVSEAHLSAQEAAAIEVHAISGADVVRISRVHEARELIMDLKSEPAMPTVDFTQFPVFILGPARSGTSVITLALLESASYIGAGEGHLLPLAHAFLSVIDHHYRRVGHDAHTALGHVSIGAFQNLIRRGFVKLVTELYSTPRWLDKTPTVEMVRSSVLMKELWPNARFIFMKRRVIENVLSRQRKFPDGTTESHYSDWAAVMSAWLTVRGELGSAALEIDHRQLILDPDAVASAIAAFLELPPSAVARFSRYLSQSRPEQTDENFGATYSIASLGLDEQSARRMRVVCDPLMTAFNYGYEESYYISDAVVEA